MIEPVRKQIEVKAPIEHAFRVFTDEMSGWWPLATHSYGGERAVDVRLPDAVGGPILERSDDGSERAWGTLSALEPPHRVVLSWTITEQPTEIEVRFTRLEANLTRVELEHRNWDAAAQAMRDNYDNGWVKVLDAYLAAFS